MFRLSNSLNRSLQLTSIVIATRFLSTVIHNDVVHQEVYDLIVIGGGSGGSALLTENMMKYIVYWVIIA